MAAVCSSSNPNKTYSWRPLLPQTLEFINRCIRQGTAPCASVHQSISLIASRLIGDLASSRETVNSLKARTIFAVNCYTNWLCLCGCQNRFIDNVQREGNAFYSEIATCILLWEAQKKELRTTGLKTSEVPKIDKIVEFLKIHGAEILEEVAATGRSLGSPDETPSGVVRSRDNEHCPWNQFIGDDFVPIADQRSGQIVLQLLNSLLFSLKLMIFDSMHAERTVSGWSAVAPIIGDFIPHLRTLVTKIETKGDVIRFIPEIKNLIRQLSNPLLHAPSGSVHRDQLKRLEIVICRDSPLIAAGRQYGWIGIVDVLEKFLAEMQITSIQPLESYRLSGTVISKLDKVVRDLTDWLAVMQDDSLFRGTDHFSFCLREMRNLALKYCMELSGASREYHHLMQELSVDLSQGSYYEKLRRFENSHRKLLMQMQFILTLLEAPIISYDDASDLIPHSDVRYRRTLQKSIAPETSVWGNVGEIPESERRDLVDWMDLLCIPLRGMIEDQMNFFEEIERGEEPLVHQVSAPQVYKDVEKPTQPKHRNRHKKKEPHDSVLQLKSPQTPISQHEIASYSQIATSVDAQEGDEQKLPVASCPAPHSSCAYTFAAKDDDAALLKEKPAATSCQPAIHGTSGAAPSASSSAVDDSVRPEMAAFGCVKRDDPDLLEGIDNFRKLKRLLEYYGFRQESGGKHLKFVDERGGKVTVPRHGGGGTFPKGTLISIGKRMQELIAKLDKYKAKQ